MCENIVYAIGYLKSNKNSPHLSVMDTTSVARDEGRTPERKLLGVVLARLHYIQASC